MLSPLYLSTPSARVYAPVRVSLQDRHGQKHSCTRSYDLLGERTDYVQGFPRMHRRAASSECIDPRSRGINPAKVSI